MALAVNALSTYQWGHEGLTSSLQSAVAATSAIAATSYSHRPIDAVADPHVLNASIYASQGYETIVRKGVEWEFSGPVHFGQLQVWLGMALLYDAAPTGTGPYTWTHTWDVTAAPSVATRTLERRLTDGSNADDDEWQSCTLNELEIRWADGLLEYTARGFGRARGNSTLTAAQTLPTPVFLPDSLSTIAIDSAWANLGNTAVTAQIMSWTYRFNNGAFPIMAADGRTGLDFSLVGHNFRNVMAEFSARMLVNTNSGQYATEQTAAEAQTLRAIQIDLQGSGNEQLTIDMLGRHRAGSLYAVDESDGQVVVDLDIKGTTDATNSTQAVLINDVASLV